MPQLDVTWFPTQLVWLALTFFALYAVISWVAVPRISGVLEERQRRIDGDLERATALKAEAEAAMAAYEKSMVEARNGAREILRQAGDALTKQSEERQKALGDKLADQIRAGEARIAEAKRAALAEVQTVAARSGPRHGAAPGRCHHRRRQGRRRRAVGHDRRGSVMLISAAQAAEAAKEAASVGFFGETETWVAIAFILVAILLYRPVSKNLTKMLDGRRDEIKNRLDEAKRLHAEAQSLLATHQQRLREAQRDAEGMLATARSEAERLSATGTRDLEDLLKRREQQAVARIAQAEADAVREVRSVAVDLAIAAAKKVIAENMTPEKAAALTDRTIKDVERLH